MGLKAPCSSFMASSTRTCISVTVHGKSDRQRAVAVPVPGGPSVHRRCGRPLPYVYSLINSLITAQKHYELLLFPDERHVPRGLADKTFMEQRIASFFERCL